MSFNHNDTIHLGNYEEFLILYMDNELNESERKMVEEFLSAHPDLQSELDILMSTKLPTESFTIYKDELMSHSMKLSSVDEELLLYIDNELSIDRKKAVELEINSNKDYALQHQLLLQTKLNRSEIISYPNKSELYHNTRRVAYLKTWMRVAVAVVVFAGTALWYFNSPSPKQVTPAILKAPELAIKKIVEKPANEQQQSAQTNSEAKKSIKIPFAETKNSTAVIKTKKVQEKVEKKDPSDHSNEIAYTEKEKNRVDVIDAHISISSTLGSVVQDISKPLNKSIVTSEDPGSLNGEVTVATLKPGDARKEGSVKGFLRKATRIIEKRTGINPANDDGELLIGAVAVKLR
ncbi:MAG: anti-sigma factor family protein [Flavisolibacter sp.]